MEVGGEGDGDEEWRESEGGGKRRRAGERK